MRRAHQIPARAFLCPSCLAWINTEKLVAQKTGFTISFDQIKAFGENYLGSGALLFFSFF